jgi:preprotein translocase subunit SecG
MANVFYIVQVILAITLIVVILMQVKSAGLGSAFGGSDASIYTTRRGVDKVLFQFTIILSVVFLITSILILLLARTPRV